MKTDGTQTLTRDAHDFEPWNIELEQALLGLALLRAPAIAFMQAELTAADFYDPLHARVFERIFAKYEAHTPITPRTLHASLKNDPGLMEVGGFAYFAGCVQGAPAWGSDEDLYRQVRSMARSVADLRIRREAERAILDSTELMRLGKSVEESLVPVVEIADFENERMEHRYGAVTIAEAGDALMREIERPDEETLPAAPTGIGLLNEIIGGYFCANLIVAGGRPGMGKAHPVDTPVLLANGQWKPIGKLRRGERIASTDGASSVVTGTFERGMRQVFRVAFFDGREVECCGDHLWAVRSRHWGVRVLDTRAVATLLKSKRHAGRLSIDVVSGDFGARANLPLDPYVLGALLGDGDISKNAVVLTSADEQIVGEVSSRLGLFGKLTFDGKLGYRIWSGGKRGGHGQIGWLVPALKRLGIFGTMSDTKFVPEIYKTADRSTRLEVLRGLMDTDGWAEKHGSVRFSSCSKQLALDVQYLVRSLGGVCSIRERHTHYTHKGERKRSALQYTCRIRHPEASTFFRLTRKSLRAVRGRNPIVRLNIASVEQTNLTKKMRCIAVSHSSRLYVTQDFIVTHNSILGELAARVAAAAGFSVDYFDLENKTGVLTARMLCDLDYDRAFREGRPPIHYSRVHLRRLSNDEKGWIAEANLLLRELDIDVHDRDELTIAQVASICRAKAARTKKPKLFIIDHMHLIEPSSRYAGRKVDEISEVTKGAKRLAKRLDSSVLLLAQLNRDLERRDDKRPTMADFRESGSIEQDADVMIGLNRPHYHLERSRPKSDATEVEKGKHQQELVTKANVLELGILKNRHGRTGEIAVYVDVASSAIRDVAPTAQTQIDFANLPTPPHGQSMF